MRILVSGVALGVAIATASLADAASLSVAPVLIDLNAPAAASSVRVHNDATKPVSVQVRIFRWTQSNGQDVYTPAPDVVASPPIATLKSGGENIVRVVRTSKSPVQGEESYRLLVDELPEPGRRLAGTVMLVVRQSIPVFFSPAEVATPAPTWSAVAKPGGWQIDLANGGARRIKISNLSLKSGNSIVAKRNGLVGYALGRSAASWFIPAAGPARPSGRTITINAESDMGPINATISVKGS